MSKKVTTFLDSFLNVQYLFILDADPEQSPKALLLHTGGCWLLSGVVSVRLPWRSQRGVSYKSSFLFPETCFQFLYLHLGLIAWLSDRAVKYQGTFRKMASAITMCTFVSTKE